MNYIFGPSFGNAYKYICYHEYSLMPGRFHKFFNSNYGEGFDPPSSILVYT